MSKVDIRIKRGLSPGGVTQGYKTGDRGLSLWGHLQPFLWRSNLDTGTISSCFPGDKTGGFVFFVETQEYLHLILL